MTGHTGSCLCGGTTYTITGDQNTVGICHCTHCQKQSGSAFSIVVLTPAANVTLKGKLTRYADTGESGLPIYRSFCPTCGSAVITEADAMPATTIIKAGTLDDTSWLIPTLQIFCDQKQAWLPLAEGTTNFPRMPG
jgi:hypothetical protein